MSNLIPQYQAMASTGLHFPGTAILQHVAAIQKMVRKHNAVNLLDYGCGRGDAYRAPHRLHAQLGLKWYDVTLYDPAFPQHARPMPVGKKFDGVLCSDVLEHIPEGDVDAFIAGLFEHARRFVWASVCCRPAKKNFPDSDVNLHVTLQPLGWWYDKFGQHSGGVDFQLTETP